ncbi:TPA: phage tail protein, partial [Escherichia coli]
MITMMKYYKDENNVVYAYDADGTQDAFIKEGLVPITRSEA